MKFMQKKSSRGKSSRARSPQEGLGRYRQAQRQKELSELISQAIWELSRDDKSFPVGLIVTIIKVIASPDAAYANIFCQLFPDEGRKDSLKYLNKKAPFLRHFVAERAAFRLAPKIHFIYDEGASEGDKILELLDKLK